MMPDESIVINLASRRRAGKLCHNSPLPLSEIRVLLAQLLADLDQVEPWRVLDVSEDLFRRDHEFGIELRIALDNLSRGHAGLVRLVEYLGGGPLPS